MFDALARLADGRGKLVVALAVVFFVVAGAVGGGVADKLDPYGADDPATETYKAAEQLRDAGHRDTSVVVLIEGEADGATGRRAGRALQTELARNPRGRLGHRLRDHAPARLRRQGWAARSTSRSL